MSAHKENQGDEVKKANKDNVENKLQMFSVDILHVVKDAQAQHGLRHGDYHRYHGYCTRRLKRIRSFLKFRMGDRRKVHPRTVTQTIFTDSRYILMLLMTSERAWSMAMHLKQEANSEPRKRHHMMEKLRKAVKHADKLNNLCDGSPKVDARTKLEAQLKKWVEAMDRFHQTQTIYKKLSETMSREEQPVYLNMIEEISPNIRYCAYTIGDQSAMDDLLQMHGSSRQDPLLAGKLDSLIAESRGVKAASMSEITWRGRVIRVKNTKVRLFLIGVKDFEKSFANIDAKDRAGQIEAYDGVLTECKDALQLTREDMKNDPHSKTSSKKENVSDLQLLHSYLSYLRQIKTIHRNLLLVEGLKENSPKLFMTDGITTETNTYAGKKGPKPSEFVRLYETVIQSLMEVTSLPGLDDDSDLQTEISAQKLGFQALRCFYIAQVYVNDKKWPEAMALYDRVLEHANEALSNLNQIEQGKEFDFVNVPSLENLVETIAFNRYRVHSSAVLDGLQKKGEATSSNVDTTIPLMERLNVYYEDPAIKSLVADKRSQKVPSFTSSYPPKFESVPCKPIFFDLAINHTAFPSLEGKLGQKQSQQKAGLSGLISNWWGWGGKR